MLTRAAMFRSAIVSTALAACLAFGATSAQAQSGPFAGLSGVWSGGGTVSLDDGSSERIRCRATYSVSGDGTGLNQSLTCASDSYKFDLRGNLRANGSALSGGFTETGRGISGNLEGTGGPGRISLTASAPGFTANVAVATRGNKQSVSISAQGGFRGANISLSKS